MLHDLLHDFSIDAHILKALGISCIRFTVTERSISTTLKPALHIEGLYESVAEKKPTFVVYQTACGRLPEYMDEGSLGRFSEALWWQHDAVLVLFISRD